MKQKVLKAFPYSQDGKSTVDLAVGAILDIRDDLVESLRKLGFVGDAPAEEAPAPKPVAASGQDGVNKDTGTGGAAPGSNGTFIKNADSDPARDTVVIPDEWAKLAWNDLQSLAAQLSPEPIRSKVQASEVIEAEVARRAALVQA